ncbi:MAG: AraC family transcriptional regulator [Lachnospiraceae bacterium]|nr:AraC family transcriptional regulator [Lachnospiraceae bacterium]
MRPLYEKREDDIEVYRKRTGHFPPHVHGSVECIYIESGSMDLGIEKEFYHLDTGDFAIVFPGQIHHFQNFSGEEGYAVYLLASPSLCGPYRAHVIQRAPSYPVLRKRELDPDIPYILLRMFADESERMREKARLRRSKNRSGEIVPGINPADAEAINRAYFEIVFRRYLMSVTLVERKISADEDLVYRCILYVAEHFTEDFTLTQMAEDLYVSQFELSRIFASTFHMNFNSYVNESRLDLASNLLRQTDKPITDIMYESGFQSQRTFNRVFKEKYRVTPREYRNKSMAELP